MITGIDIDVLNRLSVVILPVLLMTLVKSILLFTFVALLIRAFNMTSVRTKYVLWACYVFSVVLIVIYSIVSPTFNIAFLQISPHRIEGNKILSNLFFPQYETLSFAKDYTIESSIYQQNELKPWSESLHWSFWAICGWIVGLVLCLLYTLTGIIGVQYILKNASPHGNTNVPVDIHSLARNLGITRKVKVVVSCRCRLPFTYRFIHPVLVIPYEAKDWPELKLRTVLIHELSHIHRNDYLVLFLSRFICSVFWFIPVLWIAHAYLQLEQEKICDLIAIKEGERPTEYARYMIDLVRTARSLILWSGIFIVKRRNKMLEKRVTNVLNMERSPVQERESKLKIRTLASILILVLAVLIIAGSCATRKKAISPEDAAGMRSGQWANESYISELNFIYYLDGRYEAYDDLQQQKLHATGKSDIYESWRDSEGVLWYRAHYKNSSQNEGYEFGKISDSDNTLELIFTTDDLIIEEWKIGKVGYNHVTSYRQE